MFAARDIDFYHSDQYGSLLSDPTETTNLFFYSNTRPCRPDNRFIDEIHRDWKGRYKLLEQRHGYIQWLFPIHEQGMNHLACILHKPELEQMKADPLIRLRVKRSFELMLDFYGFEFKNEATGELTVAEHHVARFENLINHSHNFLRITRILKFLGLMNMPHYQTGFLVAFLEQILLYCNLFGVARSLKNYWVPTLVDPDVRGSVERLVAHATLERPRQRPAAAHSAWSSYQSWSSPASTSTCCCLQSRVLGAAGRAGAGGTAPGLIAAPCGMRCCGALSWPLERCVRHQPLHAPAHVGVHQGR